MDSTLGVEQRFSHRLEHGKHPESSPSYTDFVKEKLNRPEIQRVMAVNFSDPRVVLMREALKAELHNIQQGKQTEQNLGVELLGEDLYLDLLAQLRVPDARKNLMDGVIAARHVESEEIKKMGVVETSFIGVGLGVHSVIAANKLRSRLPNAGILLIGRDDNVFGITEGLDGWLLNSSGKREFDPRLQGIEIGPNMNHLPGLPFQAVDIDARLYPGNASIGDLGRLCEYLVSQSVEGMEPDGSVRECSDPKFDWEWPFIDRSTGQKLLVRINNYDWLAGGFGETDYSGVGDELTQQIIGEELVKTREFMRFIKTGQLPPGATIPPSPGQIVLGIEDAYYLFANQIDPLKYFKEDTAVIGAGHTGLTMLANLYQIYNSTPGTSLPGAQNRQVYVYGLRDNTRGKFLANPANLPPYLPIAELLPTREGGNAPIKPIDAHLSYMRKTEDGKIALTHIDPKTGKEKTVNVKRVILTPRMRSTVDRTVYYNDVPGFSEGEIEPRDFIPGGLTQQLNGFPHLLCGPSATGIKDLSVTALEAQLNPNFGKGSGAPVMGRTTFYTAEAAEVMAENADVDNLVGPIKLNIPDGKIHTEQKSDPQDGVLRLVESQVPNRYTISETLVKGRIALILGRLQVPGALSLDVDYKGGYFVVNTNISTRSPEVASVLENFFNNPLVRDWAIAQATIKKGPFSLSLQADKYGEIDPTQMNLMGISSSRLN